MDAEEVVREIPQPLWDGWYVREKIGSGASSFVFRIEINRGGEIESSALKVEPITLDDVMYADDKRITDHLNSRRQAAYNEAKNMHLLSGCPYIVTFEDYQMVQMQSRPGYLVLIRMEYLTCLQQYLKINSRFCNEGNIRRLAADIGRALQAAHTAGIIHRDVKPGNFFINHEGTFKLGDFNIAKNTDSAKTFAGTPGYIAPEIYRARRDVSSTYTKSADIYSFGICLYQLMNGLYFPLEEQAGAEAALDRRMSGELLPRPKYASRAFADIILKACAYNTFERYSSIDAMLADLDRLPPLPQQLQQPESLQQPAPAGRSNPVRQMQPAANAVSANRTANTPSVPSGLTPVKPKKTLRDMLPMISVLTILLVAAGGIWAVIALLMSPETVPAQTGTTAAETSVASSEQTQPASSPVPAPAKMPAHSDKQNLRDWEYYLENKGIYYPEDAVGGHLSYDSTTDSLTAWPRNGNPEQCWNLEHVADGQYRVICRFEGENGAKYLSCTGTEMTLTADYSGSSSQLFYFTPTGTGYYLVQNALDPTQVVTAELNDSGVPVICLKSYEQANPMQEWKLYFIT